MITEINAKEFAMPFTEAFKRCVDLGYLSEYHGVKIDLGNYDMLSRYNSCLYYILENLNIDIPYGNLIPTAGLRRVIAHLIHSKTEHRSKKILEIGTGPVAIMALLLANRGFNVIATESNLTSYINAKKVIKQNNFQNKIRLIKSEGRILKWLENDVQLTSMDVIFSLPPYYSEKSLAQKNGRGFLGVKSELFGHYKGKDFSLQLIHEFINLKLSIYLGILWKNEDYLNKGLAYFNKHNYVSKIYCIKAGTRKRFFTLSRIEK